MKLFLGENEMTQRFAQNRQWLTESFNLIWLHKYLIIYPLTSATLFTALQALISYKYIFIKPEPTIMEHSFGMIFGSTPHQQFINTLLNSEVNGYLILALLFFAYSTLMIIFNALLIARITGLLNYSSTNLAQDLVKVVERLGTLFIFIVLNSIAVFCSYLFPTQIKFVWTATAGTQWVLPNTINLVSQCCVIVFNFMTWFIIPIIILNKLSLIQTFKNSAYVAIKKWLEVIINYCIYIPGAISCLIVLLLTLFVHQFILEEIMLLLCLPFFSFFSAIAVAFTTLVYLSTQKTSF